MVKVQETQGAFWVTIPKDIATALGIKKGDILIGDLSQEDGILFYKKIKKEAEA